MSFSIASVGTLRRKFQMESTPSIPSSSGRPPEPPINGWMTLSFVPPVLKSGTETSRIDAWPGPNDGTSSGIACASAPRFTSVMRSCTAERLPQAT